MKLKWIFSLLIVFALLEPFQPGLSWGEEYRLGVPKGYTTPIYEKVFSLLEQEGLVAGENLTIVPIDLSDFRSESAKKKIRSEIAQKCDLFFTTGDHLAIILEVEIQSPLLFIAITGPQHKLPQSMLANATGFYRDSVASIFKQSIQILPAREKKKIGLIYFHGSKLEILTQEYIKTCEELGIELVAKDYAGKDDIERVMRNFKNEGVEGIVLFPPAIRKRELSELIYWQNQLHLPVIGQVKDYIEKGLVGGPAMDANILIPNLADYLIKILKGRSPQHLPIKYFSNKYIINLTAAYKTGLNIPEEIIEQAEIVGLAIQEQSRLNKSVPIVPGNFVIGMPDNIAKPFLEAIFKALAFRGYIKDKNLRAVYVNLYGNNFLQKKQHQFEEFEKGIDVFFATGESFPALRQLPKIKTPICFISTMETADTIPKVLRKNFTGIIRSSFASTLEKLQKMMQGAKSMGILARTNTNLPLLINQYKKIAASYDISIEYRQFSSPADIGPVMAEMQSGNTFILLFPPNITQNDLTEIVNWQNKLRFPVLAQVTRHVEAGLLGGEVVDLERLAPKIAEYIDKLLKGQDPATLPYYYLPEKTEINLRAASILKLEIPEEIITNSLIIR